MPKRRNGRTPRRQEGKTPSSRRGPEAPFLLVCVLRRLAMQISVLLAPPMLSYVPFGAARTSPLSSVAFDTAGVSYAGGAAALKSRKTLRSQNDRFRIIFVPILSLPVDFSNN